MIENISTIFVLICYAIFFGVTMKVADLLDEHGLKWFKGSTIFFGFLWGVFGALIILSNNTIANIYLALILAFVLRYRIDYLNHGIAATIMFLTFFAKQTINWDTFLLFFMIFAFFGLFTDFFENKKQPKDILFKFFRKFVDLRAQYYLFPFLYSLFTGIWLVFFMVGVNMLFYELTIRYGEHIIKRLGGIITPKIS